jgi:K+-sensing histidine kinase KdpD
MEIKNVKRWGTAGPKPYYAALFGFFVALFLRLSLHPVLEDHMSMLFFAINSILIAYFYGFLPSMFILTLSFPVSFYFFLKPYNSFGVIEYKVVYILIIYTSLAGLAAFMIEILRREQYKSKLLARVSDSRYRLLVEADEDRREAMKKIPPPLSS